VCEDKVNGRIRLVLFIEEAELNFDSLQLPLLIGVISEIAKWTLIKLFKGKREKSLDDI
jgi:hypothetical protein